MASHDPNPTPPRLEQREWSFLSPLRVVCVLLVFAAVATVVPWLSSSRHGVDAAALESRLRDQALQIITGSGADGALGYFRGDGRAYTVDLAQLAVYAALAGDRELYEPLRAILLGKVVVPPEGLTGQDGTVDAEARDMAAWGFRAGEPLDASGTTETLRVAEALWRGAQTFGDFAADRERVHRMALAYARHQAEERGAWMIRNYYNFGTRAYSTNSFLIDYDPDLVARLAEALDDAVLRGVAAKSAALMTAALTPAGLLHQQQRPEAATIQPLGNDAGFYSVNGVEGLANVLASAERCVETNRDVAERVLGFCAERLDHLQRAYRYDTGEGLGDRYGFSGRAGLTEWAALTRLAAKLDDRRVFDTAYRHVLEAAEGYDFGEPSSGLYVLGETLLALEAAELYGGAVGGAEGH